MNVSILNAFTDQPFKGNPAAVCMLSEERDSSWMQRIAKEMNLPVTAFIEKLKNEYYLRWFTPTTEISICAHGTLASAFFLWEKSKLEKIKFCYREKR